MKSQLCVMYREQVSYMYLEIEKNVLLNDLMGAFLTRRIYQS